MSRSRPMLAQALEARITALVVQDEAQLSREEYRYVADLLGRRRHCNLLVFGVGNDSSLWVLANETGKTVFLESSRFWAELVRWREPDLDIRMVRYGTTVSRWKELLDGDPSGLALRVPRDVAEERWDVIFVDGPAGSSATSPGRMKSIHAAAAFARRSPGTDVIVHDCDREIERACCARFLQFARLVRDLDRTRHYRSREIEDGRDRMGQFAPNRSEVLDLVEPNPRRAGNGHHHPQ